MPTKRDEMKWHGSDQGGRWRRIYRGKYFNRSKRKGETKWEAYDRVLPELHAWMEKVADLGHRDPSKRAWTKLADNVTAIMSELEESDSVENRKAWKAMWRTREVYRAMMDSGKAFPFGAMPEGWTPDDPKSFVEFSIPEPQVLEKTDPPWKKVGKLKPTEGSLGAAVERFLTEKAAEVKSGEITKGRLDQLEMYLDRLVTSADPGKKAGFLKRSKPVKELGNGTLVAYRASLLEMIADGKLKPTTARDRLRAAVQFVKWCVSEAILDRPPILDAPQRLKITTSTSAVETFTPQELDALVDAGKERMKLFVLLCLNCGFTQSDIGQLRQDEVDWKAGTINRKRTKTRKHHGDSVPTVEYALWPETFRLLKKYRSDDATLALTTKTGKPLWEDGSSSKPIDSEWYRLQVKMKEAGTWPGKPMKCLRKTAVSMLETSDQYERFGNLFLGHAAGSMKDKHYAKHHEAGFRDAVLWLGQQWPSLSGVTPPK